mmetsp:Transcript_69437/g.226129  ORF Transcript_69437/g.226129 Transcript_69437/m.226129 type:complete len:243 (+) Transcript_69437:124-852(+)
MGLERGRIDPRVRGQVRAVGAPIVCQPLETKGSGFKRIREQLLLLWCRVLEHPANDGSLRSLLSGICSIAGKVCNVHLKELCHFHSELAALCFGACFHHRAILGDHSDVEVALHKGRHGAVQLAVEGFRAVDRHRRTALGAAVQRHVDAWVELLHAHALLERLLRTLEVAGLPPQPAVFHIIQRHLHAREPVGDCRRNEKTIQGPSAGSAAKGHDAVEGHCVIQVDEEGLPVVLAHIQHLTL